MRQRLRNLNQTILLKLDRYSLQQRLFFSYILIILIPSIAISLIIFNSLNDNLMKDTIRKSEAALDIEKNNIKNNIEMMERTVQLSVIDREIINYINRFTEPDASELVNFNSNTMTNLLRLQFNNPNLEHIRVYSDNRYLSEIWPIFLKESRITKEPWYEQISTLNGGEMWKFDTLDKEPIHILTVDDNQPKAKISLLREIDYPQGTHIGLIQVDMLLSHFFPTVYSNSLTKDSQMIVMDEDSRLFHGSGASLLSSWNLSDDFLKQQLQQNLKNPAHNFKFSQNGSMYLGVFTYLDRFDAYLLNVTSLQNVLLDINRTRNMILIVNVVLIAILSVSTYFLNSLILKKLRLLTISMKKVRQGDFNINLPSGGGSEVGELTHHFHKMIRKINELIADAVTKQAASKEAELRTLKNQIDSHFLYNTLENIKMLAEVENQQPISNALTSLGSMMRYNLKWSSEYVRLREEMNHIRHYIAIMNLRFDDQIELVTSHCNDNLDQELLKMSLQPIVENAVKHGMRHPTSLRPFRISIQATAKDHVLHIIIEDNGVGMSAEQTAELNRNIQFTNLQMENTPLPALPGDVNDRPNDGGIGLRNVHQRIQLFYGKEFGLRLESEEGSYTRVVMKIPYYHISGGISKDADFNDRR